MSDEKTLVGAVKTEQGVEVKGMLMQPVVEKCEGCDRVRTFEEQQFCGSYPNPAKKWFDGRCNFATHIKTESGKAAKVNPLKASLSRSEAFCSRVCTAIFLRTPVFGKGVLPRQGEASSSPFLIFRSRTRGTYDTFFSAY